MAPISRATVRLQTVADKHRTGEPYGRRLGRCYRLAERETQHSSIAPTPLIRQAGSATETSVSHRLWVEGLNDCYGTPRIGALTMIISTSYNNAYL